MREWSGTDDTSGMQRLASRCWPRGLHPGGLGWSQATDQLAAQIVLVGDVNDGVQGWAGVTQPGSLSLQVLPGRTDVRAALVDWLLDTADGPGLSVDVFDAPTAQCFADVGFERATPPFGYYRMGAPGLAAAVEEVVGVLPSGYTVRSVRPDETEARVAVHRIAWRPADLPFHPDDRPDG